MRFRNRIATITKTCDSCPSQWEGKFDNGDDLYVRYRWGHLRVDRNGFTVFHKEIGGGFDGTISTKKMLKLTGLKQ